MREREEESQDQERRGDPQRSPENPDDGKQAKAAGNEIPLGYGQQRVEPSRSTSVKELERSASADAAVDPRPEIQPKWRAFAVDPAAPIRMAGPIIFVGPFYCEQRLGFAITGLLLPVSNHCLACAMPYDGRRAERDLQTRRLQLPAHINIIARCGEARLEPADRFERRLSECHVTAWDVLRF